MDKHTLEPAYPVIEVLGGKSNVAASLGLHKSAVSRWCQPVPRGTGGAIPQKHWRDLIALADSLGVKLTITDLANL
jgi:hypothetical protein